MKRTCRTCEYRSGRRCIKNPPTTGGFPAVELTSGCYEWTVSVAISAKIEAIYLKSGTPILSPILGIPEGIKECYWDNFKDQYLDYIEGHRDSAPRVVKDGKHWSKKGAWSKL